MNVYMDGAGLKVKYQSSHLGHDFALCHTSLSATEKSAIAGSHLRSVLKLEHRNSHYTHVDMQMQCPNMDNCAQNHLHYTDSRTTELKHYHAEDFLESQCTKGRCQPVLFSKLSSIDHIFLSLGLCLVLNALSHSQRAHNLGLTRWLRTRA